MIKPLILNCKNLLNSKLVMSLKNRCLKVYSSLFTAFKIYGMMKE